MSEKKLSYTFPLTTDEQSILVALLKEGNYKPVTVPYTRIAVQARSWDCNVNLYTSGKCLIQGKGAEEFITHVMEPLVLQRIVLGYEEILNPEAYAPHMGVDESGKGDFLGPLVVASAYINEEIGKQFKEIGVRDSKAISSDKQALAIAAKIRGILGPNRYSVIRIGNATYNRLYAKIKSVNRLLAWAHARCIENLLTTVPSCPKAISDQFGNPESVRRALMQKGRSIELVQRHHAESDLAVAAASILAREGFLMSLKQLEKTYSQPFPKGVSPQVLETAKTIVTAQGPQVLLEIAKCHFRTLDVVLHACGHNRSELPPEGQVQSQATGDRNFHHPSES